MVDGIHTPIWNKAKKPLAISLSGVEKGLRGRNNGDNINNVQYRSNWDCHYKSPLPYNEYVLKFHNKKEKDLQET
jgi:hypothetical protein